MFDVHLIFYQQRSRVIEIIEHKYIYLIEIYINCKFISTFIWRDL